MYTQTNNDSALSRTATPSEIPTAISAQTDASNVCTTTEVKHVLQTSTPISLWFSEFTDRSNAYLGGVISQPT